MPGIAEFDTGELDRLAQVFKDAAGKDVDLTFSMGESVRIIKKSSKANFILKGSGKYAPLSPKYKLRKNRIAPGQPILVLRGDLRDSVVGITPDSIVDVSKDNAVVGTKAVPAPFIQDGTRRMPARAFLALTTPIVDAIANTVEADVFNRLEAQLDEV